MSLDRQAIERRDFPLARRGYEQSAVDAHLRAVATEVEQLRQGAAGGTDRALASTAASQVQSILDAAAKAAAEIENQARQRAGSVRGDADMQAQIAREEAIAKARAHVSEVTQATSTLLERIASLDREADALLESLRAGTARLSADLMALDANLAELYDAVSSSKDAVSSSAVSAPATPGAAATTVGSAASTPAPRPARAPATPAAANGDLDGARLVALNMALSGEPRDVTERYLAENFDLQERDRLIEEVYAAIEA